MDLVLVALLVAIVSMVVVAVVVQRKRRSGGVVSGSPLLGIGSFAVVVSAPGRSTSDAQLDGMTKAELYDLAIARDLDGRSSMTKAELIDALASR